ncbi:MAG: potassium transporter TrkA [Chloroflexi bacterium]|nr:MAG: potassium transporter TrkA [Chloroflexota bacterium]
MENMRELILILLTFLVIALASQRFGQFFGRFNLPKISGFLVAGVVSGPFVLGIFSSESLDSLRFIEEFALAFIAFAAGSELYLPELRGKLRSIGWITASLVITTLILGTGAIFFMSTWVPFMSSMGTVERAAVAFLAASIMVARSPSVAIAVINELRAKGSFTQIALGVTVISDVVVIFMFALAASVADAVLTDVGLHIGLILLLLFELVLSLAVAYVYSKLLELILRINTRRWVKAGLILLLGYSVYLLSSFVRDYTHTHLPFEILLEPLLICMVASFIVNNWSSYRSEFSHLLHETGSLVYIAFFTLVGAELKLDVLADVWLIALAVFGVRIFSIFIGSMIGGAAAGEPMKHNRLRWMVLVTQAGVALGLAKEVGVEFAGWGEAFATMIIAVVVLNEIVGPITFKSAILRVGEAHAKHETPEFSGVRDAIIFGLRPQSVSLARQLLQHNWHVKMLCMLPKQMDEMDVPDLNVVYMPELTVAGLRELGMAEADAVVTMQSDEENYQVCEMVYEHFGTETMVARLHDRANYDKFNQLGVLVVEPRTAVVSLLEHFVRAPAGTSLLLGMQETQDIVDIELQNPELNNITIRDLRLPLDVLILSVQRDKQSLITHGYTRLKLGDKVTVVGKMDKVAEVMLRFEA